MPFDLPPATRALLIANVAVFLLQQLFYPFLAVHFALWPWGAAHPMRMPDGSVVMVGFQVWQLVTYAFMHGGFTHILFNMFALWMFGGAIERLFGQREFLIYYFVCLVVAGICHELVVQFFTGGFYRTVGASGAIFGLLLAFGMMFPHERIMLIIPPIPMPAWVFVTGYGVIELILGVTGTQQGVAHFAHLGGMLGGFLLIEYWRGKFPIKPRRRLMR
ncbi:MAG TPA: rhomboid family intramembrane serine protease [Rhodanobacteraceae bacterium]|nr:rhomboid family intramembrane serine protease [Rhodanobacteraceae bacterium]